MFRKLNYSVGNVCYTPFGVSQLICVYFLIATVSLYDYCRLRNICLWQLLLCSLWRLQTIFFSSLRQFTLNSIVCTAIIGNLRLSARTFFHIRSAPRLHNHHKEVSYGAHGIQDHYIVLDKHKKWESEGKIQEIVNFFFSFGALNDTHKKVAN